LYLQTSLFIKHSGPYFYALLLFPGLLWLTFVSETRVSLKKIMGVLPAVFMALLAVAIFFLNIFSTNNIADPYHINPVFYPLAQLAAGKTLLVGFTSFYGLFPIFLNEIFHIIGLSVLKFSVALALLFSASYLAIYRFLKNTVKNKLILLAGMCGLFVFSYSAFAFYGTPVYFQYWPIRFFPVSILILLASIFLKTAHRNIFYYLSFAWCCFAILWNLETGVVMLIAWLALLLYSDLLDLKKIALLKSIFWHAATLIMFLAITTILVVIYTYLRSGAYPDLGLLAVYQKLFFSGFLLINMPPPPHLWTAVALIYLIGLLYSLKALFFSAIEKNKIIFFLAVLGIGLFSYYEGRSHDLALIGPLFPAVLLLAIFADQLLNLVKNNIRSIGNMSVLVLLLFILYSAPVSLLVFSPTIARTVQANLKSMNNNNSEFSQNINFIRQNSRPGEKIFVVSQNKEGIYYGESGTVSVLDLGSSAEYVSKVEFAGMINFLKNNTTTKIFIDFKNPPSVDDEVNSVLKDYYVVSKTGGTLALLVKK
ncbi:MAG: hypothetical protein AAB729_05605, partial [Patescibacteria group bacterium]